MTYTVTGSLGSSFPDLQTSGIALLYRIVQGNVLDGFQAECEEYQLAKRLKKFDLNASARNVSAPIDIARQGYGSFIAEGNYESIPKTTSPKELTFGWGQYNDRYSFTILAQIFDQKQRESQIMRQAKYQTRKTLEGLKNRYGYSFYGDSSGVMCYTSTVQTSSSGVYALTAGFGNTAITDTTYLGNMFVAGDYVTLVRSSTAVSNGIGGQIISVSNTSGLTIAWSGSVISAANDKIVMANSAPVASTATLTHSDFNHAPDGMQGFCFATVVHSLSGSANPLWNPSLSDVNAGSLTGTRLKKAVHAISNFGGGTPNLLIWAQDVERNVHQNTFSQVKFDDPLGMQVIGSVKTGGWRQHTSRKVPPGFAYVAADESLYKWIPSGMMPDGNEGSLESMENSTVDKLQDLNAKVAGFDLIFNHVCTRRADLAVFTGLQGS